MCQWNPTVAPRRSRSEPLYRGYSSKTSRPGRCRPGKRWLLDRGDGRAGQEEGRVERACRRVAREARPAERGGPDHRGRSWGALGRDSREERRGAGASASPRRPQRGRPRGEAAPRGVERASPGARREGPGDEAGPAAADRRGARMAPTEGPQRARVPPHDDRAHRRAGEAAGGGDEAPRGGAPGAGRRNSGATPRSAVRCRRSPRPASRPRSITRRSASSPRTPRRPTRRWSRSTNPWTT